ncbi:MAG: hypothetical protein CMH28_09730 [Micavibrio sp.]|nr:hypothetical protein [Micavibrio sp.]
MKTYRYIALIAFTAVTCFFLSTSEASAATGTAALCGAANGQEYSSAPSNDALLCARGRASTATSSGTSWIWQCTGSGSYGSVNCSAQNCAPPQILGACGPASGTNVSSAPTGAANLCANGTPTVVSGSGPWTWTCRGGNNSTSADDDNCSAGNVATAACIPTGQPVPPGQTQCPTSQCFFWVSSVGPHARSAGEYIDRQEQTSAGPKGSVLVGEGSYPDSYAGGNGAFAQATAGTFDGIAIGSGTRVRIYRDTNYSGPLLLDITGPKVLSNCVAAKNNGVFGWPENCNDWLTDSSWGSHNPSFYSQFPSSSRENFSGNMWDLGGRDYDQNQKNIPPYLWVPANPTSVRVTCSGGSPTPPPPTPEDPGEAACGQSMTYRATAASEINDFTCPPDRKLWNKADLSSPKVYQSTSGYKGVKPAGTFGCDVDAACSSSSQGRSCVDQCGEQRLDGEQWCSYEQSPRPIKCVDGNAQQQPSINGIGCNASGPLRCP